MGAFVPLGNLRVIRRLGARDHALDRFRFRARRGGFIDGMVNCRRIDVDLGFQQVFTEGGVVNGWLVWLN